MHTHLPLFIQLVYHWEMGEQLLRVALKQVALFLEDPAKMGGSEEASLIHVSIPVKKQRISKTTQKKKNSKANSKANSEMEDREKASDLSLSLEQSIDILEAILNDTITQTSSYEKEMITNILDVLKTVVVSLQSYLFADIETQTVKRPHATLEAFVRLLALQFHIEMHINAKQSLEKAKQERTDLSWVEKQDSNPLIGPIPSSMLELCTILRREILPFNETGGGEPIKSSIGCFCLSLLHLLLVHSTKCASLLLFDEQVQTHQTKLNPSTQASSLRSFDRIFPPFSTPLPRK